MYVYLNGEIHFFHQQQQEEEGRCRPHFRPVEFVTRKVLLLLIFPNFSGSRGEGDNEFLEFPATRFTANMLCNLLIQDLSGV